VLKDATKDVEVSNAMARWSRNGYRLPTSLQSEMAARFIGTTAPTTGSLAKERIATSGKDGKTYYWTPGNYASGATENANNYTATQAVAWYEFEGGSGVKSVARKRPNALGMYDVSGNVEEWQFTGTSQYNKEIRGGKWHSSRWDMYVSSVVRVRMWNAHYGLGFRLVKHTP
jgi:formylglycine-generating enzyme required for sulfatase activity